MEIVDFINKISKIICINILTYITVIKLINYNNNYIKTSIIGIISVIEAIACVLLCVYIPVLPSLLIMYLSHSLSIAKITKNKLQYSVIVTFFAITINYLTYMISIIISGFILKMLVPNIKNNNILILLLAFTIASLIINKFFRIKRLKKGITFLQMKDRIENIGIIGCIFIGFTIIVYAILGEYKGYEINTYLFIGVVIVAICMIIWISKKLTAFYKKRLKEQTIELLEGEIKEKDKEISRILEENKAIATINHKYSSRIKSLESISTKIMSSTAVMEMMKTEFGNEFGDFEKQIKKLSEEYSNELNEKVKHKSNLPKTGVFGIDNLLEYMSNEASKSGIKFDLKVNGNINYMIENVIDQSKLETLLGDHIKDAIIAIEHSNNSYKSILTIIGIVDDHYEVCIYDTGIEFEIDTLVNLGTKAITTHKETGGSGIGFMTTFETLRATKGSLIIEEKHQISNTDYTKAVKIRFDGKEEYKIVSYRADEIRKNKRAKRVIIEDI